MYIGNDTSNLSAIVLIPYWIAEAIQRKGLTLADALNYDKIRPVLAVQDMATLMAFQKEFGRLVFAGGPLKPKGGQYCVQQAAVYESSADNLETLWRRFTDTWERDQSEAANPFAQNAQGGWNRDNCIGGRGRPNMNRPSADYQLVSQLSWDQSFEDDIKARLYGPDVKLDRYDHAFDLVNLEANVVGVVVYPGYFAEKPDTQLQLQLVQALLKVFYVSATFSEVATTSLFKRHLELLSCVKY